MYKNLLAEMARNNIMQMDLVKELKISPSTLSDKMNGKKDFKLKECKTIKLVFFPDCTIDYLFETN